MTVERDFLSMSRAERRAMVERDHPALSLSRQCRLLSIGRSSLYYTSRGESAETLALMRRIDELFLKYPFYGARQMVRHLRREVMRLMGLQSSTAHQRGASRAPGLSLSAQGFGDRTKVWCAERLPLPGGLGRAHVLAWRLSNTLDAGF